jgi:hypothetical protein
VSRGQRDGYLRPYYRLSRLEPLLFLPSSSSVVLTRLSGPHSRPTASRQSGNDGHSGSVARALCKNTLKLRVLKFVTEIFLGDPSTSTASVI